MMENEQAIKEQNDLIESVKDLNVTIEEKYDEKIRILTPEEDDDDPPSFGQLKNEYEELYTAISEATKNGKSTFFARNYLMQFKGKLAMARATKEEKDLNTVKEILKKAKSEYEEAISMDELNFEKDIDEAISKEKGVEEDV